MEELTFLTDNNIIGHSKLPSSWNFVDREQRKPITTLSSFIRFGFLIISSVLPDSPVGFDLSRPLNNKSREPYHPILSQHLHIQMCSFGGIGAVFCGLYLNYLNLNKISVNLCFLNCPCI